MDHIEFIICKLWQYFIVIQPTCVNFLYQFLLLLIVKVHVPSTYYINSSDDSIDLILLSPSLKMIIRKLP